MRVRKYFLFFGLLLCISAIAYAQEKTVSGTVTDNSGVPLPGVNVIIKGSSQGVQTDFDGNYSIRASQGQVLVFSYLGQQTIERTIGASNTIDIQMVEDAESLEEVVVVAYGTSRKEAITGAVTQISSAELEKRPITNLSTAIEGSSPGVVATSAGGQPGSGQSIRIRGFGSFNASNDPLYVVDGIPLNGQLSNINPNDIESITILKDAASTALYGNKATNGVILVTTKRGKTQKGQVTIDVSTGVTGRFIPEYDRIDAFDYYPIMWESLRNSIAVPGNSTAQELADANQSASDNIFSVLGYNPFSVPNDQIVGLDGRLHPNASLRYNDFDWEDAITRTGVRRNVDLTYQGKSGSTDYFASIGYLNETGYLINSDFERITARVNLNYEANSWLTLGANIAGNRSEINQSNIGGNSSFRNPFRFTRQIGPIYPIHAHDPVTGALILDENGNPVYDLDDNRPSAASSGRHTVVERKLDVNLDERTALNAKAYADIKLAKGLNLRANFSYEEVNTYNTFFWNRVIGDGAPDGLGYKGYSKVATTGFNQLLSYNKSIDDHNFEVLLGHESQELVLDDLNGTRTVQIADGNLELVNFVTTADLTSEKNVLEEESYFGRLNYNYAGKYFLSGSIRTDGTSRFAEDRRWGTFWSVGASWSINRENFLSEATWIDQLKLRSSYGELGNSRGIGYYPHLATFALDNNNQAEPGIQRSSLGASGLEWETSANFDVALEFGLFDRLRGSVEYYNKESQNLIFEVPVALSDGADDKFENIGTLYNRGIEVSLGYDIIKKEDLFWTFQINASTLQNKFTELVQEEIINGTKKLTVGKGLFDYWLRDWYGVDPADGSGLYVAEDPDASNVRMINGVAVTPFRNNAKFHYAGSAIPDLTGSFNTEIRYKNFSFSTLFTYQIGGKTLDYNYRGIMSSGEYGEAKHADISKRWQQPGDITNVPRMDAGMSNQWDGTSDRWLLDASFLNMRSANIAYDFDGSAIDNFGLTGLRLYVSAENIFAITARKGLNFQQSFNGNTSNVYTPARIVTFGLNAKL